MKNVKELLEQWAALKSQLILPQTCIISLLSGGAAGAIITAIIAACRNKEQRRRAFIGFLARWKAELSVPDRGPDRLRCETDKAVVIYESKLPDFCDWISQVRKDFTNDQRFESLSSRLRSLTREDWKDKPCEVISQAIDDLIRFAKE